MIEGFNVAGIKIIPSHIVGGLVTFAVLGLATRWLKTYVTRKPNMRMQPGAQIAIASIVGYVGFSLALLFALLIGGVNFAGLAIIAGALSVGIGFGLQHIVGNFVSGIVLLIERPIRLGDRIIVGNVEGYVKRISIRSTIIHSLERADVIVPNSKLISEEVTNLMFTNLNARISVFVGVAYGSDVDLVSELLLAVANEHEEIVATEKVQPMALFKDFGDSSLDFELRCVIKNVNIRQKVRSDLHVGIYKRFAQHGIEIAFPQRDLHVKEWPQIETVSL